MRLHGGKLEPQPQLGKVVHEQSKALRTPMAPPRTILTSQCIQDNRSTKQLNDCSPITIQNEDDSNVTAQKWI